MKRKWMDTISQHGKYLVLILTWLSLACVMKAEDFATAIADKKVKVTFHGLGGSSGDSIAVTVSKSNKSSEDIELTIPTGTRLRSGSSSAQSMVISGVKGEQVTERKYRATSTIQVGDTPKTYILEAYCAEFEKDNPSSKTKFSLDEVDPVLACILKEGDDLSPQGKQAAVWIYTDNVTFKSMNSKFPVSRADWDAAQAIVRKCSTKKSPAKKRGSN